MSDLKSVTAFCSTAFTIDWFAATFDEFGGFKFAKKFGYGKWATDVEHIPPRGYNKARELECGTVIAWHTERREMGVHVKMSGAVLRHWQELGVDWHEVLTLCKQCKGRVSRVDLAVDLHNSKLTLADLDATALFPYKGKGRTPKLLPVGTQAQGWTLYVGSRTSEKYLRIYDKAKESKIENGDYIRIELECKGEVAHAVGWEFPDISREDAIRMAQTLIRGQADYNLPAYQFAVSSEHMELSLPQGKERQTMKWLIDICAPALAKEIAKRPNKPVMDEFWSALEASLRERGISTE